MMKSSLRFLLLVMLLLAMPKANSQCEFEGYTYGGAYNGSVYYVSQGNLSWVDANTEAIALGGYLAAISDFAENAFVSVIAATWATDPAEFDPGAWIGFNDMAMEGTYVWSNGEPVVYTNWNAGEPNNGEYGDGQGEDYVEINRGAPGAWNDLPAFVDYIESVVEFSDADCDGVADLCDETFEDADCDGVGDGCDNCPGGDDSGPCDAESFPGFENIPEDWVCHDNGRKVYICHDGNTICVDYNAVQAHLDHGDFLGPCIECAEEAFMQFNPFAIGINLFDFEIYPNPAGDAVNIILNDQSQSGSLLIVDAMGRTIYTKSIKESENVIHISTGTLDAGDYFVQIITSGEIRTKKLTVLR